MDKLIIKIPPGSVLISNEIWDEENGEVLCELPAMLLNQATREMIQRTINAGKFEITVYLKQIK